MKRVLSIQDISGFGKCSLTVALPIISAMGISLSVVPTAILSTHTGIKGYTYRDLTEDIILFAKHYRSLGIEFNTIYTGFLAGPSQVDVVANFFKMFKATIIIDPVMGDRGILYNCFDKNIVTQFKKLLPYADIVTPNITEATFLLGESYKNQYDRDYIKELLIKLTKLGPTKAIITGIEINNKITVAIYDKKQCEFSFFDHNKVDGHYPGTGDVFCSALVGAITKGIDVHKSAKLAASFVHNSIKATVKDNANPNYGINFESQLKELF